MTRKKRSGPRRAEGPPELENTAASISPAASSGTSLCSPLHPLQSGGPAPSPSENEDSSVGLAEAAAAATPRRLPLHRRWGYSTSSYEPSKEDLCDMAVRIPGDPPFMPRSSPPLQVAPSLPANSRGTVSRSRRTASVDSNSKNREASPLLLSPFETSAEADAQLDATYRQNWTQVVLGATSGFMFVLVVWIGYGLYLLVQPYSRSITSGVLLSIVMHPRSRTRTTLYSSAAVARMRREHEKWAARGRMMGLFGSLLSLPHFVSFIVMQGVFFLGLHKIHVRRRVLPFAWLFTLTKLEGQLSGGAPFQHHQSDPNTRRTNAATVTGGDSGGGETHSSKLVGPSQPLHRSHSLVATPRGRRLLRYLTVLILTLLAHLLLGISYFLLLHLVLAAIFALAVLILTEQNFLIVMGRLWRVCLIAFYLVGLTLHFTADVLSISEAVRQTTSAVVGGARQHAAPLATGYSSWAAHASTETPPRRHAAASCRHCSADYALRNGPVANSELVPTTCLATTSTVTLPEGGNVADVALPGLFEQHQEEIASLLFLKLHDLLLRELAEVFHNGNVSMMVESLMMVLPMQLRQMVQQDVNRQGASFGSTGFGLRGTNATAAASSAPLNATVLQDHRKPPQRYGAALWGLLRPSYLLKTILSSPLIKNTMYGGCSYTYNDSSDGNEALQEGCSPQVGIMTALTSASIDWFAVLSLVNRSLLPYVEYAGRLLVRLGANLLDIFDSIYAFMLFIVLYRHLTQLEHTVLYYGIAKVLRAIQPGLGDTHARNIESDITTSFITLLQSFWHLTWFHFTITFCAFKAWGLPTPFLFGLVSVLLALFPLVPKWLSPCSIALVCMAIQAVTSPMNDDGARVSVLGLLTVSEVCLLRYACIACFTAAVVIEYSDEWLLCVSRGLHGGFLRGRTTSAAEEREQVQPFVVGTALVLGFVAYGMRGIILGPLTVIVARALFDNWDIVLTSDRLLPKARRGGHQL